VTRLPTPLGIEKVVGEDHDVLQRRRHVPAHERHLYRLFDR
jgi:hypothetical protein